MTVTGVHRDHPHTLVMAMMTTGGKDRHDDHVGMLLDAGRPGQPTTALAPKPAVLAVGWSVLAEGLAGRGADWRSSRRSPALPQRRAAACLAGLGGAVAPSLPAGPPIGGRNDRRDVGDWCSSPARSIVVVTPRRASDHVPPEERKPLDVAGILLPAAGLGTGVRAAVRRGWVPPKLGAPDAVARP